MDSNITPQWLQMEMQRTRQEFQERESETGSVIGMLAEEVEIPEDLVRDELPLLLEDEVEIPEDQREDDLPLLDEVVEHIPPETIERAEIVIRVVEEASRKKELPAAEFLNFMELIIERPNLLFVLEKQIDMVLGEGELERRIQQTLQKDLEDELRARELSLLPERSFVSNAPSESGFSESGSGHLSENGSVHFADTAPREPSGFSNKCTVLCTMKEAGSEAVALQALGPSWCLGRPENLQVRSPNYLKNKNKMPSGPTLYNSLGADIWSSPKRIKHIAQHLNLPWAQTGEQPTEDCPVPPLLIINCQLPMDESNLFSDDGPTVMIVMYFELTTETRDMLNNPRTQGSPAVSLLKRFCSKQQKMNQSRRFKVICQVENTDTAELPEFVAGFNGKPVLITNSGSLFKTADYFEIDINVHRFNMLAKKTLLTLKDTLKQLKLQLGFVLEGKSEAELPETLLASISLSSIDLAKVPEFSLLHNRQTNMQS